jgi:hypothetical protein
MSKESKSQKTNSENQQEPNNKKVQFFNPTKKPVAAPVRVSSLAPTTAEVSSLSPVKNEDSYFPTPQTYPVAFPTSATTVSPNHESSRIPTSLNPQYVPTEAPTFVKPTSSSTEAPSKAVSTSESSRFPTTSFSPANVFLSEVPSKSPIQYSQIPTLNPIANDNNGNTNRPSPASIFSPISNNQTPDYFYQRINTALSVTGIVATFALYLAGRRQRNEERRENTIQRDQEAALVREQRLEERVRRAEDARQANENNKALMVILRKSLGQDATTPATQDEIEQIESCKANNGKSTDVNLKNYSNDIELELNLENIIGLAVSGNHSSLSSNEQENVSETGGKGFFDFFTSRNYFRSEKSPTGEAPKNEQADRVKTILDRRRTYDVDSSSDSSITNGMGSISSQKSNKIKKLYPLLQSLSISPTKPDLENEEKNSEYRDERRPVEEKSLAEKVEETTALLDEIIMTTSTKSDLYNNPPFHTVDSDENQSEKGNIGFDNQSFVESYAQRRGSGKSEESRERSENQTLSPDYKSRTNPLLQKTSSIRVNPTKTFIPLLGARGNVIDFSEQLSSGQNSEENNSLNINISEIHPDTKASKDIDDSSSALITTKLPVNFQITPPASPKPDSKTDPLESPRENYSSPEVSQTQSLLTNSPPEVSRPLLQPSANPILTVMTNAVTNLQNLFNSDSYQRIQNSGNGSAEKGKGQGKGR